jgi:hypothetical protein
MGIPSWLGDDIEYKVVVKQSVLRGSPDSNVLQKIATVYINGREYRVYAPPDAKGHALDWLPHFTLRDASDTEARDAFGILAFKAVKEELERQKRDANRVQGMHPDGLHCDAQICLKGHVQHSNGAPFDSKTHCTKCGAACIDECPNCREPIRGGEKYRPVDTYEHPQYCHGCGRAYPWMADRLQTARELLRNDEKFTMEDRNELFEILQDVMSDPKSPLTPAKNKLMEIKLEKGSKWIRELLLDLAAKTAAEAMKG